MKIKHSKVLLFFMRKVKTLLNFKLCLNKCDKILRVTTKNGNITHKFKSYKRENSNFLKVPKL